MFNQQQLEDFRNGADFYTLVMASDRMTKFNGIFTAKCGTPDSLKKLITWANMLVDMQDSRPEMTGARWKKIRGPYWGYGQVCIDYGFVLPSGE